MRDTSRPGKGELSPQQKKIRASRARIGTVYVMTNIEDRVREDLSLIRIRVETYDYGQKGKYYCIGYMTSLAGILHDCMLHDNPTDLSVALSELLNGESIKWVNALDGDIWKRYFRGRVDALSNSLRRISIEQKLP